MYLNYGCMWTRFEYVGNYADGCNYVFAFEAQALLFEEDVFLYLACTRNCEGTVQVSVKMVIWDSGNLTT